MKQLPKETSSRLQVILDQGSGQPRLVLGECAWVPSRFAAAFEWSKEALESVVDPSPLMMKKAPGLVYANHDPFSGIHPLFADSIPDGFGFRLMNRGLADAGYNLAEITPLQRLAWVGERGFGALSYKPVIGSSEPLLTSVFEAAVYAAKAEVENFKDIPRQVLRAGGSALGARPKFWAWVSDDNTKVILGDPTFRPAGFAPSLLKFAPKKGDPNEPYLEAACLELAAKYGVRAALGHLLDHPEGAALAVRRFDRLTNGARVHTQTVAALLGVNFREPSLDYQSIAQLARKIGDDAGVERLYRQMCFNVSLSMRDDHAKNFAFCMGADGQWTLSPAFDLCPSTGFGLTQEHTTTIKGKGAGITRDDLMTFAQSAGLPNHLAKEGIDNARAAAEEFESLAISLGATKTRARQWARAFKRIDGPLKSSTVSTGVANKAPSKPKGKDNFSPS